MSLKQILLPTVFVLKYPFRVPMMRETGRRQKFLLVSLQQTNVDTMITEYTVMLKRGGLRVHCTRRVSQYRCTSHPTLPLLKILLFLFRLSG